ncbi:MAG TPA: N-acetyltransferase [Gemmataceae bacterium]
MRKYIYFKRYRMEADLRRLPFALLAGTGIRPAMLPLGFQWLAWRDSLLPAHAEVKALCFQDETDAIIFPCLASFGGCRDLMAAIRGRPGFCPPATWLVTADSIRPDTSTGQFGHCIATVQGVVDGEGNGGIQNVGVIPEFRGRGLGQALVLKALAGFLQGGGRRAYLEVTAKNHHAVRIYRALGFRCAKTVYRAVEQVTNLTPDVPRYQLANAAPTARDSI